MNLTTEERTESLKKLYTSWFGIEPSRFDKLPPSGSNRVYYRMGNPTKMVIGVVGENERENLAFIEFSKALRKAGIRVPEIYAADEAAGVYIQQDLGSTSLFDLINQERKENGGRFTTRLKDIYKKVLSALVEIQIKGRHNIDFNLCYPRSDFDAQSMMWDLQYFKYYFLRLAGIEYDEAQLEADFTTFINYLTEANCRYFMYRDFQSRNIMIDENGDPWFIDYQGGRRGARQYDVASLLYDAKADIPNVVRNELLAFYISRLRHNEVNAFLRHFYGYCVIRIMQAMGAYGYRGYFERKEHFLKSIPFALDNLKEILRQHRPAIKAPELLRILDSLCKSEDLRALGKPTRLKVRVFSFSYKHGIPADLSGNGGGHVFDCRALPNPGRIAIYMNSTGRDSDVIEFFKDHDYEMKPFLEAVKSILEISILRYLSRGFTNLMVSFGCTGGQHRSVYCAEIIAKWIEQGWPAVEVELKHTEQE